MRWPCGRSLYSLHLAYGSVLPVAYWLPGAGGRFGAGRADLCPAQVLA
jgi:hypothetical protein